MSPSKTQAECLVCSRARARSIYIAGYRLCSDCEQLVATIDVNDPAYDSVVRRLRLFWHGLAEAAASSE